MLITYLSKWNTKKEEEVTATTTEEPEAIALARQLYEREGALVVTARS